MVIYLEIEQRTLRLVCFVKEKILNLQCVTLHNQ